VNATLKTSNKKYLCFCQTVRPRTHYANIRVVWTVDICKQQPACKQPRWLAANTTAASWSFLPHQFIHCCWTTQCSSYSSIKQCIISARTVVRVFVFVVECNVHVQWQCPLRQNDQLLISISMWLVCDVDTVQNNILINIVICQDCQLSQLILHKW